MNNITIFVAESKELAFIAEVNKMTHDSSYPPVIYIDGTKQEVKKYLDVAQIDDSLEI